MASIRIVYSAIIVIVVLSLCGCVKMGRYVKQEQLDQIKEGESTRSDVIRVLGSPFMVIPMNEYQGGQTLAYSYSRATQSATNFIPVIGIFSSSTKVKQQQISISLDDKGVVRKMLIIDQEPVEVKSGLLE